MYINSGSYAWSFGSQNTAHCYFKHRKEKRREIIDGLDRIGHRQCCWSRFLLEVFFRDYFFGKNILLAKKTNWLADRRIWRFCFYKQKIRKSSQKIKKNVFLRRIDNRVFWLNNRVNIMFFSSNYIIKKRLVS